MPVDKSGPAPSGSGPAKRGGLEALSEAIESGAGLPAVARAAASALDASIALIDRSSTVLAVAAGSTAEEEKLLAGRERRRDRRAAGRRRGRRRAAHPAPRQGRPAAGDGADGGDAARPRAGAGASRPSGRATRRPATSSQAVLGARLTDPGDIAARAAELGADLERGAGRRLSCAPTRSAAQIGDLARARPDADAAGRARGRHRRRRLRSPTTSPARPARSPRSCRPPATSGSPAPPRRCRASSPRRWPGFQLTIGFSRHAAGPVDLYRAGKEALLAVNVGEAEGRSPLAFEDTGSYRLLLPAMSEDPGELERFYGETVAPLVRLRRAVRDRARRDRRGLPRERRQRHPDRRDALHPPPHDPLPARARPRALRPRPELDRGPREARPRPQGDAGPRHRRPPGPGDGAAAQAERGRGVGPPSFRIPEARN